MKQEIGIGSLMAKVNKLKTVDRTGWVKRGVKNPESVADHSFGVGILAILLADKVGVDSGKVAKMSIIHDLAESIVGDIIMSDGVSVEEKHKLEEEAMVKICQDAGSDQEILGLWREFEAGLTKEALLVRRLDKLEMMFQANSYNKAQPEVNLDEFWTEMEGFDFGELQEIYNTLKNSR